MTVSPMRREARLIVYSAGNFGKNLLWSAADVTLLFVLAEILRVPSAVAGWIVLVALLGDAALGLLVGAMLARSPGAALAARFALIGAPVCGAAFAMIFAAPSMGSWAPSVIAFAVILFRVAYALLDVPHNMMMTRVTGDSRARSRVSGYRFLFSSFAALAVALILLPALASYPEMRGTRIALGFAIGSAIAITVTISGAVAAVGRRSGRPQAPASLRKGLVPPLTRPLPALYAIALTTGFALPMFARLLLFDSEHLQALNAGPAEVFAAITAGQFGGVVVWTWLASRRDKILALALSHATAALACGGFAAVAMLGGQLSALSTIGLCSLLGFGLAGVFGLPWAALSVALDFAEHTSGERCEPQAFAYLLAALKVGAALGGACVAWSFALAGYAPGATQNLAVRHLIVFGGTIVPLLGSLLCILLCRRIDLTHAGHARVMAELRERPLQSK